MSTFSPYKYRLNGFDKIKSMNNSHIENFYNAFSFFNKPIQRNAYKISLAQILNYLVDFGIGYNSVCVTTVTTYQSFNTARYVNRHGTSSDKRPATISQIKEKLKDAVQAMIRHAVKYGNTNNGIKKIDTVYPKYIFTLDTDKNLIQKLKLLTGCTYKDISDDFTDFAYTSDTGYAMPAYSNGYVPADTLLMCPPHNHETHPDMRKSMVYKWSVTLETHGNVGWEGCMNGCYLAQYQTMHEDPVLSPATGPSNIVTVVVESKGTASWQYPNGVVCEENEKVYPENTMEVGGKNVVPIRYPGRRYRLLVKQD